MIKDNHENELSSRSIEEELKNKQDEYLRRISYLKRFSSILAIIGIIFSFLILLGWLFNIPFMRGDITWFYASKFNSGLAMFLAGCSLYLLNIVASKKIMKSASGILAALVFLIGFLTFMEYVLGINIGLDQLFYSQGFQATNELFIGRAKLLSALTFIFLGAALLSKYLNQNEKLAQISAIISGFITFYGFTINIYGIQLNHLGDFYFQMGIYTSIIGMLLSVGILFSQPHKGVMKTITRPYSGGKLARILIVGSLVTVFLVGLLVILGERFNAFSFPVGLGLLVVASAITLFILIFSTAKKINKLDLEQEKAFKTIQSLEKFYEKIIESLNEGIFVTNKDDEIVYFNAALRHIKGLEDFNIGDIDHGEQLLKYYAEAKNSLKPSYFETLPLSVGEKNFYFTGWVLPEEKNGAYDGSILTLIDDTERKFASELIEQSLNEKDILLREIHHRVKNNLQIISSLLNLQSEYVKDERDRELFINTQNRVKSMALIHSKLYQSDNISQINIKEYITNLAEDLLISYQTRSNIQLETDLVDVFFNLETAIPCGLIVTELITNSLKYAFEPGQEGKISINLKSDPEENLTLIIRDNGKGIPESIDFQKTNTLGLELVNMLVKQIEGSIELDRSQGTEFTIKFRETHYPERS